jgi:ArsR family transcriptional regulator, arsenate/arsenite/antimonite-responsive transcriptional repressor
VTRGYVVAPVRVAFGPLVASFCHPGPMPSRATSIEVRPGAAADASPGALTGRSTVDLGSGLRAGAHGDGPHVGDPSGPGPVVIGHVPLDSDQAGDLAGTFKALGDPVRLRLLSMIVSADDGEICVCDLSEAFPLTGPTISHHLRILREAGLVHSARRGTWVYYRAVPGELARLAGVLDAGRIMR